MAERRYSTHPKPWLEETSEVSAEDLQRIIAGSDGIFLMPSRGMDEVFPNLYVGE